MQLQSHPTTGDQIKGYTLRGCRKIVNKRRGFISFDLLLENENGARRVAAYYPKKMQVGNFRTEIHFHGNREYPSTWNDQDLNTTKTVR